MKPKPCPWCSSTRYSFRSAFEGGRWKYWIVCMSKRCGATGPKRGTDSGAEQAWNKREEKP